MTTLRDHSRYSESFSFKCQNHKLNHTSFDTLIEYSNLGLIPCRLRHVTRLPLCDSCLYGKQHWRPWRTSGKHKSSIRKDSENEPVANTSVDHMISAHPGLIPQVTGKLTLARFWAACVFVDHFTFFIYIHLCRGTSRLETIEAKEFFPYEMTSRSSITICCNC